MVDLAFVLLSAMEEIQRVAMVFKVRLLRSQVGKLAGQGYSLFSWSYRCAGAAR